MVTQKTSLYKHNEQKSISQQTQNLQGNGLEKQDRKSEASRNWTGEEFSDSEVNGVDWSACGVKLFRRLLVLFLMVLKLYLELICLEQGTVVLLYPRCGQI